MNKIAKIRIPSEKMEAISEIWTVWIEDKQQGEWAAHVYADDQAFIQDDHVLIISGDSEVINPIVSRIMLIVTN